MSNYIDLIGQITESLDVPCGNIRLGIHEALAYLDRNPDQVPGRTITEGELSAHEKGMGAKTRDCLARMLGHLGITVTPDPEPTNAQSIGKLLTEFANLNASCGGEQGDHDLAEFLDAHGVRVSSDD